MVAPILAGAAKVIGSAGLWTGATKAFQKIGPKLKESAGRLTSWIGSNKGASAGAGALGGFGFADVTQKLGIQDQRIGIAVYGALVLGVIVALGQLFDIQIGGN